jgi:hypothetical protein
MAKLNIFNIISISIERVDNAERILIRRLVESIKHNASIIPAIKLLREVKNAGLEQNDSAFLSLKEAKERVDRLKAEVLAGKWD